jgi:hypothetical protein
MDQYQERAARAALLDAHFSAHNELMETEIAGQVVHSALLPIENQAAAVNGLRQRFQQRPEEGDASPPPQPRQEALRDVSKTYRQMLETSKEQGAELLRLHKQLGEEQLKLQREALEEFRSTSHSVHELFSQIARSIEHEASRR